MANPQIDILMHAGALSAATKKARRAVEVAAMFSQSKQLKVIRFWKEDFDSITTALKGAGHRSDGFRVGHLKAVRFDERA